MKLTKKAIDQAHYEGDGKERYVLWDDALSGFGLRVYPSGKKSFVVFYRSGARQRFMTLGTYGVLTLVQARDQARKILVAARDGEDPLQSRRNVAGAETVVAFCERYVEEHAKPRKKSWRDDRRRIDRYIVPAFGSLRIESVTRQDVTRLYHRIGGTLGKTYEANRVLALLSVMFRMAATWGVLPENSGNPARLPRSSRYREQSRDRPLTSEELPRLLEAIDRESDPFVRAAIHLYLLTGLRRNEVLRARWEDIDFERGTLRLAETKAGKPRHVPLSEAALETLRSVPRTVGNPHVFASPTKVGAPRHDLNKPWRRIRESAGCPDLRIHDLRHTVATWLAEEGHAAQFIQQALGHQSLHTTMKYIHATSAGSRKALDGLGARLRPAEVKQA